MNNDKIKQPNRLSLRKETITKLTDAELKKAIGGIENPVTKWSCIRYSCDSVPVPPDGSCAEHSCFCPPDAMHA